MHTCVEVVQPDEYSSFRSQHFTCPSLAENHGLHCHPEIELTWLMQSQGLRFVGDSIEPYRADDLVLVGAGVPHRWRNDVGGTGDAAELIVLQFRLDTLGPVFSDIPEAVRLRELWLRAGRGLQVLGETARRVRASMASVPQQTGMQRLICLLEILNDLASSTELRPLASVDYQMRSDVSAVSRQKIELVFSFVRERLHLDVTQAEVAGHVGMTAAAFSRFFHRSTGETFVSFVNRLRINEACRRLISSNETITAIAQDCGYGSIANFNRQFLANKGMRPSEFRRTGPAWRKHPERSLASRHALVDLS